MALDQNGAPLIECDRESTGHVFQNARARNIPGALKKARAILFSGARRDKLSAVRDMYSWRD